MTAAHSLRTGLVALLCVPLLAAPAPAQQEEDPDRAPGPAQANDRPACDAESRAGRRAAEPRYRRLAPFGILPVLRVDERFRATAGRDARIDTVIVRGGDIFASSAANRSFFHALLNELHIETRSGVIRRELLLKPGERFDCALARETERNLRARGLFREVSVDSSWSGDRLALVVTTRDAWTLQPRFDIRIASDGTVAGAAGATERNVAGTGHLLQARYIRDVDRDGFIAAGRVDRLAGTGLVLGAAYHDLSDRTAGAWTVGHPFRSLSDHWSLSLKGEAFSGRVLQYRTPTFGARETMQWRREALTHEISAAYAPVTSPLGYLRVGATAELRRESFGRRLEETGAASPNVPDTTSALLGAFLEWRRVDYRVLRHFNGFNEEDVDLGRSLRLATKLVTGGGDERSGLGTRLVAQAGGAAGPALLRGRLVAGGLLDGGRVDSGRVVASASAALLPAERHVTFLETAGGMQRDPYPGRAFDLGFLSGPRLWPPHAFSGTRMARVTLEHRWYALERLLDVLGLGVGAFLDYGGAWYGGDDARLGGNAGLSLLFGWRLGPAARVGQIAAGYRFGGGIGSGGGERWAVSLGSGVAF